MSKPKYHPICSECKGKNVDLREFRETVWNPVKAEWDDDAVEYDSYEYCNHCGADHLMEWVSLETYAAAPMLESM